MSRPIETGNQWVDGLTNREVRECLCQLLDAIEAGCAATLAATVAGIEARAYGEAA